MDNNHCRFCGKELKYTLVDLGFSPLSNAYLSKEDLDRGEYCFPLRVQVCDRCFLAQAALYEKPENIFGEYQYFSSFSTSWLAHCKDYVDMIVPRLGLTSQSRVLEIACNDGYLLQYFQPYRIPAKGIEPAENVAETARKKGIDVRCCFFNSMTAQEIVKEDGAYNLIIGNNVLAHVPDIDDFVHGLSIALAENGTITMEFPHLMELLRYAQFDTIYHEHFHYLSLFTVQRIFGKHGMTIYDVEQLPTHGGSLRIYAAHDAYGEKNLRPSVAELLSKEKDFGIENIETYAAFSEQVRKIKQDTVELLAELKQKGKHIAAFGAAAKGNTFLNYCGIKADTVDFVVDSNPHKQGFFLPGSLIPIVSPEKLRECRPDYVIILPWNIRDEIAEAAKCIREWDGKFITCIPEVRIF